MHTRRIHRMHAFDAGNHRGDHRPRQFVDDLAEGSVFLRRATHHRERPNRPFAVIDFLDFHHGKIVPIAVIAQMISERSFGQRFVGIDPARDAEIGLGINRQRAFALYHPHRPAGQSARRT